MRRSSAFAALFFGGGPGGGEPEPQSGLVVSGVVVCPPCLLERDLVQACIGSIGAICSPFLLVRLCYTEPHDFGIISLIEGAAMRNPR